ncbi:MAG TPA: GNAT family protein [Rhabdaerophilum sp.]|nr:GNAT family protein [Rhabdaerophilum sp.]
MARLLGSWLGGRKRDDFTLECGELRLRAPAARDYERWADLRSRSYAFLQPWEPNWPEDDLTSEAFKRRLLRYRDEREADLAYPFFIERRADNALLGGINLNNIRRRAAMSATLGYWMGAPHAGQGYMSAAVPVLCAFAFARLGLFRVEAACLPENAASIRVLEKAGFQREGYVRGYLSIAGARRDHLLFALLATDRRPG